MKDGITGGSGIPANRNKLPEIASAALNNAEYSAKKASIFGDNKIKELKRTVGNDTEHGILVGRDKNGRKIRVDAETLEELVTVETAGKNKYMTKSEFDKLIQQVLQVKELPAGMTAEFQHGNLVFKRSGDILTSKELQNDPGLIAQRQKVKDEARAEAQKLLAEAKRVPVINTNIDFSKLPDIKIAQVINPTPQGATSEIIKNNTETPVAAKKKSIRNTHTPAPTPANPTPEATTTQQPKKPVAAAPKPTRPKKIITTSHHYERGLSFPNGNSIEAEDKRSVWDSDASFSIGHGKYNLKRSRKGLITNTLDYGDLKSKNKYGFINGETGVLNPNSRLFESQYDRNPEKIYFEGTGELNGAQVLKYKNKVAVVLNGKYYDLNILIQQNKKVEIK